MAQAATKLPINTEDRAPPRQSGPSEQTALERLWAEMENLFEHFGMRTNRPAFTSPPSFDLTLPRFGSWGLAPAVDVAEKNKHYEITAELPGISPSDVEVKLSHGTLTIKGEKKEEKEQRESDYVLSERRYGSFVRSFRLPDGVAADKIEAQFTNGVLSVKLPKSADSHEKGKTIPVKAA